MYDEPRKSRVSQRPETYVNDQGRQSYKRRSRVRTEKPSVFHLGFRDYVISLSDVQKKNFQTKLDPDLKKKVTELSLKYVPELAKDFEQNSIKINSMISAIWNGYNHRYKVVCFNGGQGESNCQTFAQTILDIIKQKDFSSVRGLNDS